MIHNKEIWYTIKNMIHNKEIQYTIKKYDIQ